MSYDRRVAGLKKQSACFKPYTFDRSVALRALFLAACLLGVPVLQSVSDEPKNFSGTGSYYDFIDKVGLMWEQDREDAKEQMHTVNGETVGGYAAKKQFPISKQLAIW